MSRLILCSVVFVAFGFCTGAYLGYLYPDGHEIEARRVAEELKLERTKTAALTHCVEKLRFERENINANLKARNISSP